MILNLILTFSIYTLSNFGSQSYPFLNPVTADGFNAVLNNPANLGLKDNPNYSIRLASVNASAVNNLLSLNLYNQYLGTDSAVNDEQKTELFNTIPDGGLKANGDLNLGALDFSYRNFGFAFHRVYLGNVKVTKELIDLLLFGNQLRRNYDLNDFSLDYTIYNSFNFAAGFPILKGKEKRAAIGIGLKYLLGDKTQMTQEASGNFYSDEYYVKGQVNWTRNSATGGSGWGIDIGSTYEFKKYRLSLALLNLSSGITWAKNQKTKVKNITIDSTDVYQIVKNNNLSQTVRIKDTSYNIESFRTPIPTNLTFGTGWQFDNFGSTLALIYEQNLVDTKFSTYTPKFTFDLEWNPFKVILINPSISFGGNEGLAYALGIGKNFSRFLVGINLESIKNPIITQAKGLKFGLSIGITPP
jgi:hypothetical protein